MVRSLILQYDGLNEDLPQFFEGAAGTLSRIAAFRFICDCLSWPPPERLSRAVSGEDFSWTELIALAHEYRVSSAVAAGLSEAGVSDLLLKDAAVYFASTATHCRQRSKQIRSQAIDVAQILNAIGVTPLFMKGGAHLSAGLYPDPGMRQMADLDILVPAERIDDCVAVLGRNGITRAGDHIHPRAHHHQPLVRSDYPLPIELHHEVLAYPNEDFLPAGEMRETCTVLVLRGARIAVPSPTCAAIHAIAHAQLTDLDYVYGRFDLRGLLDLALLTHARGDALDWDSVCQRFDDHGKQTALGYQLSCAADLMGLFVQPPSQISKTSQLLYARALYLVERPQLLSLGHRLLRPLILLRKEVSEPDLRRRLAANMADRAWWRRHLRMLMGR